MNLSSQYGPDRSLLLAIGIVTGMAVLGAGGIYVISSLSVGSGGGGGSVVGAGGHASVPSGQAAREARTRRGPSPIAGGGVPAWAGSGGPSVPSGPFAPAPQGNYDIDPDLGHAELSAPSAPSGGGGTIAGAGNSRESGRTGRAPSMSSSAPDLSGRSFGGATANGGAPQWRSEAQALASRSRALSNAIGRLDRQGSRGGSRSRSAEAERTPEEGTTASGTGSSTTSNPGTPNDPDQVPLGGTEWLAAAGAAYALNRLREESGDEGDSEDDA